MFDLIWHDFYLLLCVSFSIRILKYSEISENAKCSRGSYDFRKVAFSGMFQKPEILEFLIVLRNFICKSFEANIFFPTNFFTHCIFFFCSHPSVAFSEILLYSIGFTIFIDLIVISLKKIISSTVDNMFEWSWYDFDPWSRFEKLSVVTSFFALVVLSFHNP